MDHTNSSEHLLLLDVNHGDRSRRIKLGLRIDNDMAQNLPTMRPSKTPRGCYGGFALLEEATRLRILISSFGKHCTCMLLRFWNYSWTAETSSYVFSLLTFAGLVAMLLVHQDKAIPEWPQIVSINSIVSLFSLFMRTGVGVVLAEGISQSKWQWYRQPRSLNDIEYLDLASRGPWGSVLMLCNMRISPAYCVAALGALATIMTSLTGFFSQQLVQFETCLQRDAVTSVTVAKTNNYTAHGVFISNYTADEFGPMVAAINIGLIQPAKDHSSVLVNGCSSGNCIFPSTGGASISTVGIGHVCENISTHISRQDGTTMLASLNNSSHLTIQDGTKTVLVTAVTASIDGPSFGMVDISMLFRERWDSKDFEAVQCSLYPTVNTYGVNITNSVMNEQLVESVPIMQNGMRLKPSLEEDRRDNHTFPYRMATTHTLRNGSRELCMGSKESIPGRVKVFLQRDDVSLGQPVNASIPDTALYYPADCVWSFGLGASSGIRRALQIIFHDQELIWGGRLDTSGSVHLRALFQPPVMKKDDLDGHLRGNISLQTVDEVIGTMAKAMAAVVRTNGYERFQGQDWDAHGDMWYTTTCVRIRWEWITFPVVMLGLTGAFLLLVIVENYGVESNRLWKSSVLAALFCEVDLREEKPVDKEGMREIAKSTCVSLEDNGGGVLRLIAH